MLLLDKYFPPITNHTLMHTVLGGSVPPLNSLSLIPQVSENSHKYS